DEAKRALYDFLDKAYQTLQEHYWGESGTLTGERGQAAAFFADLDQSWPEQVDKIAEKALADASAEPQVQEGIDPPARPQKLERGLKDLDALAPKLQALITELDRLDREWQTAQVDRPTA